MSLYTKITNASNHPEGTLLQEISDIVVRGGVWDLSTSMITSEKGAGADMSVDVSTGTIYLERDSFCRPIWSDGVENVTINSNASGDPRITSIVVYTDLVNPAGTSGEGADVSFIIAVDGTPSASPSAPSTAVIESAIGASDPYEIIANVTVADGATAISDSDIADARRVVHAKLPKHIEALTYSASVTPDLVNGDQFSVTLTGNITIGAPSNMQVGDWVMITFLQDGTGGRSVTWFSSITWMSPDTSINTTASKKSIYAFKKTGSSTYEGYLVGKEY